MGEKQSQMSFMQAKYLLIYWFDSLNTNLITNLIVYQL